MAIPRFDRSIFSSQQRIHPTLSLSLICAACLPASIWQECISGSAAKVGESFHWEGKAPSLFQSTIVFVPTTPLHSTPLLYTTRVTEFIALLSSACPACALLLLPSPLFLLTNQLRSVSAVCRESYY